MHVILSVKAQYSLAFLLNCCNIKISLFGHMSFVLLITKTVYHWVLCCVNLFIY